MTFDELNLNKPLLNALADLEYVYPTPIQRKSFSVIMSGRDVLGIAQTGTGKTYAYLLPLLRMLSFSKQRNPRIVILAPTHELVLQIVDEIKKLSVYTSLRAIAIVGGANINKQKQAVYDGTDIIVATPGRLLDLAYTKILSLKSVQKLVIDEVDEMLSLRIRSQLDILLDKLPNKRQNLMFSSTISEDVNQLIEEQFSFIEKIEIEPHGTPLEKITQIGYYVPNYNTKVNLLEHLLNTNSEMSKVLIFVKTKKIADKLYQQLHLKFLDNCGVIHSNKAHNTRLNAVKNFDEGKYRIIIATDIIARGMDLTNVSHIVNFDISERPGDYLHRIGRTGRADKEGMAISFINEVEKNFIDEIQQLMGMKLTIVEMPDEITISKIFSDDEKPKNVGTKKSIKVKLPKTNGAFHEKKDKNKKTNAGSPKSKKRVYSKSGKLKYKPGGTKRNR